MRKSAWVLILAVPLLLLGWGLTIAVPTVYESWKAFDKIFVEPADREHLNELAPTAPDEMPEGVIEQLTPSAEPDGDATGTPAGTADAASTATDEAGAPVSGTPEATATPEVSPTPFPEWNGKDPFNIVLLGVDQRPSETNPGRSDTIIVVRVDPSVPRVDMFSIPRDLLVDVPGYADQVKVNSAFPVGEASDLDGGGPTLVAQTIELNFGIPIHYFATVNIPGLERIIDTLGGVVIDVPEQLWDNEYPTEDFGYTRAYFPTGLQKMDGVQAVRYARTRHSDGDLMRNRRQQQLLLAVREQALDIGILAELPELISEVGDTVRTDLSFRQTLSLARLAQDLPSENIYTHSLAPYLTELNLDTGFYWEGDWESLRWIAQHLPEDPAAESRAGQ